MMACKAEHCRPEAVKQNLCGDLLHRGAHWALQSVCCQAELGVKGMQPAACFMCMLPLPMCCIAAHHQGGPALHLAKGDACAAYLLQPLLWVHSKALPPLNTLPRRDSGAGPAALCSPSSITGASLPCRPSSSSLPQSCMLLCWPSTAAACVSSSTWEQTSQSGTRYRPVWAFCQFGSSFLTAGEAWQPCHAACWCLHLYRVLTM